MNPNEYYNKVKSGVKAIVHIAVPLIVMMFLFVLLCISLGSCSPKVVTVPEYHKEYINSTDTFLRVDSLVHNTNTIIREANKGDSAMLAEYGIKLKNNERVLLLLRSELERAMNHQLEVRSDTVIKTDSVSVPYPVEKQLTWWQQTKVDFAEIIFGILVVIIVFFIIKVVVLKR